VTGVARDLAQARMLLDLKRHDEAASLLAPIVAAEPENSQAWCLLAAAHIGAGRSAEAAAAAERAISVAPADAWPYRLASIAHRRPGEITTAIRLASEACRLAPNEWRGYICLAHALLATEVDFDAAAQAAANALRLAPNEPDAHFIAGQVSYAQQNWKAARAHYQRALALHPTHSGALNELGRVSIHRGGHRRAAGHFIQAARSEPGVRIYGSNAEAVIRRVLGLTVLAAWVASLAVGYLTLGIGLPRGAAVLGYVVAIALVAGYGAVQLGRLPPELRRLYRTRRKALALGTIYGAILIALIIVAVVPARALPGAMLAASVLILASGFAAQVGLRRKDNEAGRGVTRDRAPSK
jgi:tetratricopeptide (TPR) repeat protein